MASANVQLYGSDQIDVSHHVDTDAVFLVLSANGPLGVRVVFGGTPDELAELLRRMAEQVDLGERAIVAALSEPLPLEVS